MSRSKWLSLLLFASTIGCQAALAAVRTWPGSAPCDGGIQACIDGSVSGDVILLAADVPAGPVVTIEKSLTLRAVPGMAAPVVGADFEVSEGPAGGTVDVRLLQLHFSAAAVEVTFQAGSGHAFTLADSVVDVDLQFHNGLRIHSEVDARFTVERNTISSRYWWGIYYSSDLPAGAIDAVAVRENRITTPSPGDSYGGLYFLLEGAGTTGASVHSNLIYDVNDVSGAAGIKIDAKDTAIGNIQILNNTIDDVHAGHGIYVTAPDPGATLYAFVYNSIVSNVAQNWLQLPAAQPSLDVYHDYNSYHQAGSAGYGGFPAGAHEAAEDPLYLDAAAHDYVPGLFSPCVNSGTNSVASGIPVRDVAGLPRVLGGTVDRGAHERAGTLFTPYLAFADFFSDGALDAGYLYEKGDWTEDGRDLVQASKKKARMRLAEAMQCGVCSVEFDLGLTARPGAAARIGVVLWYEDEKNHVELLLKPRSGTMLLRERVNGRVAQKAKAPLSMEAFRTYRFRVSYDGTSLTLRDLASGSDALSLLARASHAGGFGFRTKATTGYLAQVVAY